MKKIAALMLALVIAIAAIGCSAPADQNQDNTPANDNKERCAEQSNKCHGHIVKQNRDERRRERKARYNDGGNPAYCN